MATAYWEDRVKLAQRAIDRRNNTFAAAMFIYIERINRQLIKDVNSIISRNAKTISPKEFVKFMNQSVTVEEQELIEYRWMQIADERQRKIAETKMQRDRARMTKIAAITALAFIALTRNAERQINGLNKHLKATAGSSYMRTTYEIQKASGYAFKVNGISNAVVEQLLKSRWSGVNYSNRVWKNRDMLASNIEKYMKEITSSGKLSELSLQELKGNINFDTWRAQVTSKFKTEEQYSKYVIDRLVRTETTYMANAADAVAFEECGIDKYEFVAVLDNRTSQICRDHDGKIYDVSEREDGVNYPPLHVYCRSAAVCVLDSVNRSELKRRARNPETGKNETIPAEMSYRQWEAWVNT